MPRRRAMSAIPVLWYPRSANSAKAAWTISVRRRSVSSVGGTGSSVPQSRAGSRVRRRRAVGGDDVAVPVPAGLDGAALGPVVDVDEAEALGVPVRPLEVVQ